MTVETATAPDELNTSLPLDNDTLSEGPAHIRLIKTIVQGADRARITDKSAAYTFVIGDAGDTFHHPSTDANARTWTIPANASVAYPTGTTLTFLNMTSQAVTIAITSDTMYLIGAGSTGSRTLAQYGLATAIKIASTTWVIAGTNLT